MEESTPVQASPNAVNFKIFEKTVEVYVREKKFVFNIPTVRQTAKIAQRAKTMRIKDGGGDGSESGLSFYEIALYRAMAHIEELLTMSDDPNFFSEDPITKGPIVNSENWPLSITEDYILEVYDSLLAAVESFRSGSNQ